MTASAPGSFPDMEMLTNSVPRTGATSISRCNAAMGSMAAAIVGRVRTSGLFTAASITAVLTTLAASVPRYCT